MDVLQQIRAVQNINGFLPREQLKRIAAASGRSEADVIGTAEFYSYLSLFPCDTGEHIENLYAIRRAGSLLGGERYDRAKIFSLNSEQILSELRKSGMTGRSSGFSVADKWEMTAKAGGSDKYVICNADEGELFTGKDRAILEANANAVIDGIALCAKAVGANSAFIYLRAEYADLYDKLTYAIASAGHDINIKLHIGMGSYVCGEETALISSIEGKRGETRLKPPFPGACGLYGKPTVVANVETLAWTPYIMSRGAEWFRSAGSKDYSGSRLYTVTGCVQNEGVYEMTGGVTAQTLIEAAGGAVEALQAIQIGGGSGAIVKPDTSVNVNGCGCGSVRFIGASEDILEHVIRLTGFFARESCGICTPCRIGLQRVGDALQSLKNGCSDTELQGLCEYIRRNSRCALGRAAVTPVLSLIGSFAEVVA